MVAPMFCVMRTPGRSVVDTARCFGAAVLATLLFVVPLVTFTAPAAAIPAAAEATESIPATCGPLDPALDGDGHLMIAQNDGYYLDRFVFDSVGRLYVNTIRIVNNEYVVDRIRRYLPNGAPDPEWGNGGVVDVAGQVHSTLGRTLAVDERGRLWFARGIYLDVLEVRRFNSDGSQDAALPPIEQPTGSSVWHWDPVGDMVAIGDGVLMAYGRYDVNSNHSSVWWWSIGNDGSVASDSSIVVLDQRLFVLDVAPDGWTALQSSTGRGYIAQFDNDKSAYFSTSDSFYVGVTSIEGEPLFYGDVRLPGADHRVPMTATIENLRQTPPMVEVATEAGAADVRIGHVAPDGSAVGLRGDGRLIFATIDGDGTFVPTAGLNPIPTAVASNTVPIAVQDLADGSRMIAAYRNYESSLISLVKTLPDNLGPQVSDQALRDQVSRLYTAYFLRPPDAEGLQHWMRQRAAGVPIEAVSEAFASSPEFVNRYGSLSNRQFVRLVYQNVLGREPEPAGRDLWTYQLNSGAMTRGEVMLGFSESAEYVRLSATVAPHWPSTGAVQRLYRAYFRRDSDAAGLCYWSRLVDGGADLAAVSQAFAGSAEFNNTYGALGNRAFVELVYENVLGRAGETVGIGFWTFQLNSGAMTRGEIMLEFSEAAENVLRTGTLPFDSPFESP